MKTIKIVVVSLLLPILGFTQPGIDNMGPIKQSRELKGTIRVLSSPELFDLSSKWAVEFEGLNPDLDIRINLADKINTDKYLPAGNDIRILYDGKTTGNSENITPVILGREIFVAVISKANPYIGELFEKGVGKTALQGLFSNYGESSWGKMLGNSESQSVNIFIADDPGVPVALSNYTGVSIIENGFKAAPEGSIRKSVSDDPYSIGFCRMSDILDQSGRDFSDGIFLLPIDKNGNGLLDSHENIYSDYGAFTRGVWIGKYPKEMFRNIYSLTATNQRKESVVAFLEWIITSGQENLVKLGYDDIVYNEKRSNLKSLFISEIDMTPSEPMKTGQVLLAVLIVLIIVTGLIVSLISGIVVNWKYDVKKPAVSALSVFDISRVLVRNGLHFDKSHMWAFMNEDGMVKIGVDDFLQHITGPISKVKVKLPGERVKKGEKILTIIQRGKRLNIYSPVSGIIREYNNAVKEDSNLINTSPYNDGWVYLVEPTNWITEIQTLLLGKNYLVWLKEEMLRLKDFLANSLKSKYQYSQSVVLQEGGELRDGILNECGPEIWEEFQTNFIDKVKKT